MAHRDTKATLRLRRQKVHRLRSQRFTAEEIYNPLKEEFPHITLATIYSDIKYLKAYSKDYIALEYVPNLGDEFMQVEELSNFAIGEAVSSYYNGVEEVHNITLPDGRKMTKVIRKIRDPRILALIAQLGVFKMKLADSSSALVSLNKIIDESKKLLNENNELKSRLSWLEYYQDKDKKEKDGEVPNYLEPYDPNRKF